MILIQPGKAATGGNEANDDNTKALTSMPDNSGFVVVNEGTFEATAFQLIDPKMYSHDKVKQHPSLIPGEVKVSFKFRRDFLNALKDGVPDKTFKPRSEESLYTDLSIYE
jgi:hypothetical protein